MSTERLYHFTHLLQVSKKSLQSLILYNFFHDLIYVHVYSPGAGGIQPPGDKILMSTETSCHFGSGDLKNTGFAYFSCTFHISNFKILSPSVLDHMQSIDRMQSITDTRASLSSVGFVSAWCADGCGFDPWVQLNILSWRFGHEILSTAILSLTLTQVGQLLVTGKRICTKYWLSA